MLVDTDQDYMGMHKQVMGSRCVVAGVVIVVAHWESVALICLQDEDSTKKLLN